MEAPQLTLLIPETDHRNLYGRAAEASAEMLQWAAWDETPAVHLTRMWRHQVQKQHPGGDAASWRCDAAGGKRGDAGDDGLG